MSDSYNPESYEEFWNGYDKQGLTVEELQAQLAKLVVDKGMVDFLPIDNDELADLAVTAEKLAQDSVGSDAIQDLAIKEAHIAKAAVGTAAIQTAAITTALIQDLAVKSAKIGNAAIKNVHISDAAIENAAIHNLAVTTAKIDDLAVSTAKIAEAAINTARIQNLAVTTAKIDNLSVNTAKIRDLAVTTAKIANLAVGTAQIANAAIENAKIAEAAIDTANIVNAAITREKVESSAIGTAEIEIGSITTALIKDAAVDTAQLADASITDAKIEKLSANKIKSGSLDTGLVTIQDTDGHLVLSGSRMQVFDSQVPAIERVSVGDVLGDGSRYGFLVRGENGQTVLYDEQGVYEAGITDGAVTNPKIGNGAVKNENIYASTITGDRLVVDAITAREIAAKTITANSGIIADATIDTAQIVNAAISEAKIQDLAVTNAKIANAAIDTAQIADLAVTDAKIQRLKAGKITVGPGTIFDSGYDPTTKADFTYISGIYNFATTAVRNRKKQVYVQIDKANSEFEVGVEPVNSTVEVSYDIEVWIEGATISSLISDSTASELSYTSNYVHLDGTHSTGNDSGRFSLSGMDDNTIFRLRINEYTSDDYDVALGDRIVGVNPNLPYEIVFRPIESETPSGAQNKANGAYDDVLNLWAYANTTEIDGGHIRTNTIDAQAIDTTYLSAIATDLGTVTAGSIEANTTIDVGTDIHLGQNLVLDPNGQYAVHTIKTANKDMITFGTVSEFGETYAVNLGGPGVPTNVRDELEIVKGAVVREGLVVGQSTFIGRYNNFDGANDLIVNGQFEASGVGGASMYKLGVGTGPPANEGDIFATGHISGDTITSNGHFDIAVAGNIMKSSWTSGDRFYMAPQINGSWRYGSEFGYRASDDRWYAEAPLDLGGNDLIGANNTNQYISKMIQSSNGNTGLYWREGTGYQFYHGDGSGGIEKIAEVNTNGYVYAGVGGSARFGINGNAYLKVYDVGSAEGAQIWVNGTARATWNSLPKVGLHEGDGNVTEPFMVNNPGFMRPALMDMVTVNGNSRVPLDERFLSFVGGYHVFTNNGKVTNQQEDYFDVEGEGPIACMIIGIEAGKEEVVGYKSMHQDEIDDESNTDGVKPTMLKKKGEPLRFIEATEYNIKN